MKRIIGISLLLMLSSAALAYDVKNTSDYWLFSDGRYFSEENQLKYTRSYISPDGTDLKGRPIPTGSWVDKAWDYELGDPNVVIAIIDTGVRWEKIGWNLVNRFYISFGEVKNLPPMLGLNNSDPLDFDVNKDGGFNSGDYQHAVTEIIRSGLLNNKDDELRIKYPEYMIGLAKNAGVRGILNLQELVRDFSDNRDNDGNGFIDDVCGWNFFEDNNDVADVSSYSAALYHGTGQAGSAAGEIDREDGEIGVCPNCTVMPVKSWDSFVQDTNYYGIATLYAAQNGAHVIEGALGGINNSGICKAAFREAYYRGLPIFIGGSDLNSSDHNFPTYLDEPVYISGIIFDTDRLEKGIAPRTYFRNSGLCQYGSKNQISWQVETGSHSTALTSGAAGLLISHAMHMAADPDRKIKLEGKLFEDLNMYLLDPDKDVILMHPDQIKQLLLLTCDDIIPGDSDGFGSADPSLKGWDQHFGYGKANIYGAMKALDDGVIPGVARITSPEWSYYFDLRKNERIIIKGDILVPDPGNITWVVEVGAGVEPETFNEINRGSATGKDIDLANIDASEVRRYFPAGTDFSWITNTPEDKYPGDANIQPNKMMFTVRLRLLTKLNNKAYREPFIYPEDRRAFYLCEDKNLHRGWPVFIDAGGESSLRFEDLDGDNMKEVIVATSDGRILIFRHDGIPYTYKGSQVEFTAEPFDIALTHNMKTYDNSPLRLSFITPAVADIDGDGVKEIISVAGSKVYCFKADGRIQPGFPQDFSKNFKDDSDAGLVKNSDHSGDGSENTIGPGTMACPLLWDLDSDGKKEIIIGAGDQRLYVWKTDGTYAKGFPVYVRSNPMSGGKIIYSPCLADIDGDGTMEIVVATNESINIPGKYSPNLFGGDDEATQVRGNLPGESRAAVGGINIFPAVLDIVGNFIARECMVYAIRFDGAVKGDGGRTISGSSSAFMKGWPVKMQAFLPDILPLLGPSSKPCAFDYEETGRDDVVVSFTSGKATILDGNGKTVKQMSDGPFGSKAVGMTDKSLMLNLFDSSALGDVTGDGNPEIIKGGITLFGAANLGLSGMNLPYNHAIQVWNPKTGKYLDSFPRAIDDYVMYSEPCIADVDGDKIPDIVVGSELFLLHAFGSDGMDKTGFPKMTAGSMMTTSAVSDIDGDGNNEVGAVTREGGIFIWNTPGKYTSKANWPTYGHDNFNTSNLRVDGLSPAGINEYEWTTDGLTFICPGDDGFEGKAKEIKILGYSFPVNAGNYKNATVVKTITNPAEGGKLVYVKIPDNFAYYAVIAKDRAGNTSQLMLDGGPMAKEQIKAEAEGPTDDSGRSSGWCFINSALGH
jgi:hypothetical protein